VVDHLSTLVEASKITKTQRGALSSEFALGSADAYLQPEELAVYQFEPSGVVRSVFDRERGVVDWSTFTAVSEHESAMVNALVEAEAADQSRLRLGPPRTIIAASCSKPATEPAPST
jgi:hypothetical protein